MSFCFLDAASQLRPKNITPLTIEEKRINTQVKIKLVNTSNQEFLPKAQTDKSAGMDVRANISAPMVIHKGCTELVPLGFALDMSGSDLAALLLPRSGLGHKSGIVLGNLVGLIDGDYQGQVFASVWNRNHNTPITIHPGERIAQLVFTPLVQPALGLVDEFTTTTVRGEDGFGSTGTVDNVEPEEPAVKTRRAKKES